MYNQKIRLKKFGFSVPVKNRINTVPERRNFMKVKSGRSVDMCSGPVLPQLLKLTVPIILSSILQLLFNAADLIVVGKFAGNNSLAAVGSTTALVNLMTNLFLGLSTSANVLTARFAGAGDKTKVNRTVHTALSLSLISGMMLTVIGILFAGTFLKIMDSPENVIDLSARYLRIYFTGMPAMMVYNFGSSILRSKGDTQRPLIYLTAAGAVNVVLNLIFVIALKMDVAGVGLATAVSQWLSAGLIIRCLMHEDDAFRFSFRKLRPDMNIMKLILKIGIPAGFQGVVFSLSNVVIQSSINRFGDIAVAGSAAAASIEGFIWVSMNAFSQGALTFTSQNIGAGKFSRLGKITVTSCICAAVTGIVMGNTAYFFGEQLLGIYTDSPDAVKAGMIRMFMVCCFYFTCGLMDAIVGNIRGMGFALTPTIVSLIGACGLRILWISTLFRLPQFHTQSLLFISYPVSWVITFSAHMICYRSMRKKYPYEDKKTIHTNAEENPS